MGTTATVRDWAAARRSQTTLIGPRPQRSGLGLGGGLLVPESPRRSAPHRYPPHRRLCRRRGVMEHTKTKDEKKKIKKTRRRMDAASSSFGGPRTCFSGRRSCRSSPSAASVLLQYSGQQVAVCARAAHVRRRIVGGYGRRWLVSQWWRPGGRGYRLRSARRARVAMWRSRSWTR